MGESSVTGAEEMIMAKISLKSFLPAKFSYFGLLDDDKVLEQFKVHVSHLKMSRNILFFYTTFSEISQNLKINY